MEIRKKQIWDLSKFDFDACLEQLESKMKENSQGPKKLKSFWQKRFKNVSNHFHKTRASSSKQTDLTHQQIKSVANHLLSTKIFDEALEFYKQLLNIYESKSLNTNREYDVAWANVQIGRCLIGFK